MEMYSVQFKNESGVWLLSRYFDHVKAARRWARWLLSHNDIIDSKVENILGIK